MKPFKSGPPPAKKMEYFLEMRQQWTRKRNMSRAKTGRKTDTDQSKTGLWRSTGIRSHKRMEKGWWGCEKLLFN